jgi:RimJ/RimL family protein N-acetyltransferase
MASHRPLHTPRLTLLPADVARLEPLLCNIRSFTFLTGLKVADQFCSPAGSLKCSLTQLRRARAHERAWLTPRLLVRTAGAEVIGVIAFQGRPNEGCVEVGYSVAPAHQNAGFATEAVRAFSDHAVGFPEVHTVTARTRPERSASTRVLEKCGFQRAGDGVDSVHGPMWIWEKARR